MVRLGCRVGKGISEAVASGLAPLTCLSRLESWNIFGDEQRTNWQLDLRCDALFLEDRESGEVEYVKVDPLLPKEQSQYPKLQSFVDVAGRQI